MARAHEVATNGLRETQAFLIKDCRQAGVLGGSRNPDVLCQRAETIVIFDVLWRRQVLRLDRTSVEAKVGDRHFQTDRDLAPETYRLIQLIFFP